MHHFGSTEPVVEWREEKEGRTKEGRALRRPMREARRCDSSSLVQRKLTSLDVAIGTYCDTMCNNLGLSQAFSGPDSIFVLY
mmetsp:Transcript_48415/g.125606  ORF Transcript_48415/g.125606 Transcript_48415/m.125606 type:complete len:82 (+) Transcript_48415:1396-1641(+)